MNLNEYQQQAITLAAYPSDHELAYLTLGLMDEVGELLQAEVEDIDLLIGEMGDVCWYAVVLANCLGQKAEDCYDDAKIQMIPDVKALFYNSVAICGRVKKILRGDPDDGSKARLICQLIGDNLRRIEALAAQHDVSLEGVCERNLNKLFDRKDRGVLKGDGDKR